MGDPRCYQPLCHDHPRGRMPLIDPLTSSWADVFDDNHAGPCGSEENEIKGDLPVFVILEELIGGGGYSW